MKTPWYACVAASLSVALIIAIFPLPVYWPYPVVIVSQLAASAFPSVSAQPRDSGRLQLQYRYKELIDVYCDTANGTLIYSRHDSRGGMAVIQNACQRDPRFSR